MAKLKQVLPWEPNEEKPLLLRVERHEDESVIVVVDARGLSVCGGQLLTLSPNGCRLISNVDPALGFPLDPGGKIKLDED